MITTKKLIASASIVATLFMGGCKEQQQAAPQSKKYELCTIEKSDFSTSNYYTASVKGQQDIEIYPQVSGYLQQIAVKEGQRVKRGDLLFTIEPAPFLAAYNAASASVDVAKAAVASAELNYNNAKSLKKNDIISESELQMALNTFKSSQAQLKLAEAQALGAKTNLDFTKILSPANGVVGKLPYRKGALVSSAIAKSLTTISDNSQMYVYFSMGENQIYSLLDKYDSMESAIEGMPELELKLSNGTIYPIKGKLESISGVIDNATGAVSLRAAFDNPNYKLLSGSTANVIVPVLIQDAIVIPKAATYDLQDKTFVYRVVDGVAKSTNIEIAKGSNAKEYVVTSGLNIGDVIVASGAGLLREGTPIK